MPMNIINYNQNRISFGSAKCNQCIDTRRMKLCIPLLLLHVVYCSWLMTPKEVHYIFKRTECNHYNPKFAYKVVCPHKFVNRSIHQTSMEMYIHPELKIDKVHIEISSHKRFRTVFRPTMIKLRENFCDVVANKSNSYFATEIRKCLKEFDTNFDEPCPMMGRKYQYSHTRRAQTGGPSKYFPPLIPIGDWKVVTELVTYMNGTREFLIELVDFWEVRQVTATQF